MWYKGYRRELIFVGNLSESGCVVGRPRVAEASYMILGMEGGFFGDVISLILKNRCSNNTVIQNVCTVNIHV